MEKRRDDVCGCQGVKRPEPPIDQSLIETGPWPVVTPELIAASKSDDFWEREQERMLYAALLDSRGAKIEE